jgi:hypothetical protein
MPDESSPPPPRQPFIRLTDEQMRSLAQDFDREPARLIAWAREIGMTDQMIAKTLVVNRNLEQRQAVAEKFAEHLGWTVTYFKRVVSGRP